MRNLASILLSLFVLTLVMGSSFLIGSAQSKAVNIPAEWQTAAERSNYAKTSSYEETIEYSKRLARSSSYVSYRTFGKSGEGRDLPLLIVSKDKAFTPEAAKKTGKAIIFIQAGIHAGEIDGKDAGLALIRDIVVLKTRQELLDNAIILFVPIYNVDGHENSNPYMRINQNGPVEMGFRANATNLNLNRDYMKADAPETRGWLSLWNSWDPDLFIDCHVTDGADFQYNVTYEYAHFQEVSPAIKNWMDEHFDGKVVPLVEKEGNLVTHYVQFAGREVTGGVATFIATPRFATGYTPLRNRAGLLIETHVYKPYDSRVRGTYDVLRYTIEEAGRSKESLFAAIRNADVETTFVGLAYNKDRHFPLRITVSKNSTPMDFKGVEYKIEQSPITGANRIVYGTKPLNITIPRYDEGVVTDSVVPPRYYIVPPQWKEVISVIERHGVGFERLKKTTAIEIEGYKLSEPKWSAASFEGRITLNSFKQEVVTETREFAAGSILISLDQPAANVVIHLLEPKGPDSLLYWGFFNSIFEQKEYGESYIIEKIAADMLTKDADLKKEFEEKLKDEAFAKNARARLQFFYERSPYYLNQKIGVYPVGRILTEIKKDMLKK
ncbi:MAG: peptidase M14 [Acidobacteria bacterium]|nr:peptidase M14 [Acidobacteriota bacterium]